MEIILDSNESSENSERSKPRLNAPSVQNKNIIRNIRVFIDKKFEDMEENPNTMYIFEDILKIDFGKGRKYPAVNRKVHKWASKCITNQRNNLPRKFLCNGLENHSCKAIRWQYFCEGICRKKNLDDNKCCKYGKEKKLVVFFEGIHQCKNQLHKVTSIEDIERRIEENFPTYNLKTGYDELPDDLNNDVIFLLPLKPEDDTPLTDQVRCGRKFEKFGKKLPTKEEYKVFGPYVSFTKKTATCKGFYKCSNNVCPYFTRFNAVNQVIERFYFDTS